MQLAELVKRLETKHALASNQQELTYSDEYAVIEMEQQKLSSVYGDRPNYELIIQNALILLEKGSGHFFILTVLAYAMLQQYKWQGFFEGVQFVDERLATDWDSLYPVPERIRGRIQSFGWLLEQWSRYLDKNPLQGLAKEFIERLLQALGNLDKTVQKYFADQLSMMSLIRPLEDHNKRFELEQKSLEERRVKEAEAKAKQQAEQLLNLQNTLAENATASKVDEHLELLKQNPFDFAVYKYRRAEMWWRYPLSSQELLSLIDTQGFNWDAYAAALKLSSQHKYDEALIAFETLSADYPYYLDLQLQICDCLEELQADETLLAMLKKECCELCRIYPELEEARINNEFAVCSKQTKAYFGVFQKA